MSLGPARLPLASCIVAVLAHGALSPRLNAQDEAPAPPFVDISAASGIQADNFATDPPKGTVINDHSRLAFSDLNGDGFDDIVMHSLFPNPRKGVPFEHLVFLNRGDGTFAPFHDESGLRDVQAGFFAFGDVDNDGDQDLYAGLDIPLEGETSAIYRNDGTGRFTRVEDAGVEAAPFTFAACATFADFNGDAKLDLYVGNGGSVAAVPDFVYQGNGDGTFTDRSAEWLAKRPAQPSNGVITCDFDDDGDLDVFVSTYGVSRERGLNHLWRNDGSGRFTEVGVASGFAVQATGNAWLAETDHGEAREPGKTLAECIGSNGFGLDCGDVDGDGDLDVLLATISHPNAEAYSRKWSDPSQLLMNGGADASWRFEDSWRTVGLPFNEGDVDAALVDFDNDGRLDVSLSRERKYEKRYENDDQKGWFGLFRQRGDGTFESIGRDSGINEAEPTKLRRMKGAQNHAWSDVDRDGDLDLLVGGRDQGGGRPNFLFRNDVGDDYDWLAIDVIGDGEHVDRDGFGTRLSLQVAGDRTLVREKKSARGMYNSEDTRTLHFGLGGGADLGALHVRWLDGTTVTIPADALGVTRRRLVLRYPDRLDAAR